MIENFDLTNNFHYAIADGKSLKMNDVATGEVVIAWDNSRTYTINSYGYRGPEFTKDAEIIYAGCSTTYGLGVPEEAIWGNILASSLNLTTTSGIAKPGASVFWIVEKIFSYFEEFGHPKYLTCLFPDPHRFVVPLDGKVLGAEADPRGVIGEAGTFGPNNERLYNGQVKHLSELLERKFLKRPYNIKDIYTFELSLYDSVRAIRFLEQYCSAVGVNLLWSTWDYGFSSYIKKINKSEKLKFKYFFDTKIVPYKKEILKKYRELIFKVDIEDKNSDYYKCIYYHSGSDCECGLSCHDEIKQKYGERNFYLGTDVGNGEHLAHPGVHLHAHYAEAFAEELMLRYLNELK